MTDTRPLSDDQIVEHAAILRQYESAPLMNAPSSALALAQAAEYLLERAQRAEAERNELREQLRIEKEVNDGIGNMAQADEDDLVRVRAALSGQTQTNLRQLRGS